MLAALSIRDIVLIDRLDLEFGEGLFALTGETGAGKSILLDAFSLAIGARGDASLVRRGAAQGQVTATFEQVARNFTEVIRTLFPGGSGRLRLTDDVVSAAPAAADGDAEAGEGEEEVRRPDEPGIELEVKPAGKRIEALSLLSGGEKALTAIAFLFSLLLTKPSPFYVLDEVEAALDDTNIERFLDLLRAYQERAQFIVITHQRRTMEAADALYGVSMRGDGVTTVVSQRLPRPSPVVDLTDGAGQAP